MKRFIQLLTFSVVSLIAIPTAFAASSLTSQGSSTATETTSGLSSFFNTLWESAPSWIAAMIVLACSFIFSKMMKERMIDKFSEKFGDEDQDILVLIGRATYMGSLTLGVTIALSIAGIDLTAIIAAAGFGIGFAMQDLIMNFMAGVLILLNRQFTIGDYIQVNDTIGQVQEIQSRSTVLKALDGTKVIVPNADLFTNQVTSYTSNPFRRIEIGVGVEYRTDLGHASQVILEALRSHNLVVLEPAPAILIDEFADSSINFLIRFWVDSHSNWMKTKSEVIHLVKKSFDAEGIGIPFPIRTLAFDKDTEDVLLPTYSLSSDEYRQHQSQRQDEGEVMTSRVVASEERAKLNDIKAPTPIAAEGGGVAAPVAPKPIPENASSDNDDEILASMHGALDDQEEDLASYDEASRAVQAQQDASTPIMNDVVEQAPSAPPASQTESGASFLNAN